MRPMQHILITVLSILSGAALSAQQQTQPQTRERAPVRHEFRERVVDGWTCEWREFAERHPDAAAAIRSKVDGDGNGVVERDEARAAREAVQIWRRDHLQEEWRDFREQHPEAAAKLREKVDQDGDGTIEPAEAAAAHEQMQQVRAERREHWQEWAAQHPEAAKRFEQRADRNGDGKVGPGELHRAHEQAKERRDDRRDERPRSRRRD